MSESTAAPFSHVSSFLLRQFQNVYCLSLAGSKVKSKIPDFGPDIPPLKLPLPERISDFVDVKKAAANTEARIISIFSNNGHVSFGEEAGWELKVCETEDTHNKVTFEKKYIKDIAVSDVITLKMCPNFVLHMVDNVILLIAFEQTFD